MPWVLRGLRNGVVTTGYPARPDAYSAGFAGAIGVDAQAPVPPPTAVRVCPTGALGFREEQIVLDRGRCILCGACVRAYPDVFGWAPGSDTARLTRTSLVVPEDLAETEEHVAAARAHLAQRVRHLRRSVHVRHVDAGSDGSEEWEIQALLNPTYDVNRLGIFFTASPRHADILLVTGAGARGMLAPLTRTRQAMPDPVVTVAVGTDAISGGLVGSGYATSGGVLDDVAADVLVPGSPPPPFAILHGILLALDRIPTSRRRSVREAT